jgi:putative peptide zinc metalloprotease protein
MTAAAMVAGVAIAPPTNAMGADNTAVNVNTHDGQSRYRVAFKIQRVNKDVVDDANTAVAVGSCDGCQTVSVAIQTLLLFRDPRTFAPKNLALALNIDCSQCNTLATAYQDAVQTGGPAHFTAAGNRQIAGIRHDLQSLRTSDLSIYEVQERVDGLHTELSDVLASDLVSAGRPKQATPRPTATTSEPASAEPTAAEPPETAAENGTSSTGPVTAESPGDDGPVTAESSGDDGTETDDSAEPVASNPSASSVPTPSNETATPSVP